MAWRMHPEPNQHQRVLLGDPGFARLLQQSKRMKQTLSLSIPALFVALISTFSLPYSYDDPSPLANLKEVSSSLSDADPAGRPNAKRGATAVARSLDWAYEEAGTLEKSQPSSYRHMESRELRSWPG